jgi:hypothetical protein
MNKYQLLKNSVKFLSEQRENLVCMYRNEEKIVETSEDVNEVKYARFQRVELDGAIKALDEAICALHQ